MAGAKQANDMFGMKWREHGDNDDNDDAGVGMVGVKRGASMT